MKSRDSARAVLGALLLGLVLVPGGRALAQDADSDDPTPRPSHIHEGTCDALIGPDFVEELTDLEIPAGDALGTDEAVDASLPVTRSFTILDVSLDELLDDPYAIDVHLSRQETDTFVACGEIAGVPGIDGGIAVALQAIGGSNVSGIAYLLPNPADPTQTVVSVLVADGLAGGDETGDETEEETEDEGEEA